MQRKPSLPAFFMKNPNRLKEFYLLPCKFFLIDPAPEGRSNSEDSAYYNDLFLITIYYEAINKVSPSGSYFSKREVSIWNDFTVPLKSMLRGLL